MKTAIYAAFIALAALGISLAQTRKCGEEMLLDGGDPLVYYAMDTTGHWLAITKPFTNMYRVIIDGIESKPYYDVSDVVFSPAGDDWAYFASDHSGWSFVTKDTISEMGISAVPGGISYSRDGRTLSWSYFENGLETIFYGANKKSIINRAGDLFPDPGGNKIAYAAFSGSRYIMNIDGKETVDFDSIIPIGWRYDGKFLYAGLNGGTWVIYKNDVELTERFVGLSNCVMNKDGTVAAAIVSRSRSGSTYTIISDEYTEPLYGAMYDNVYFLKLHPELPLASYVAVYNYQKIVCMNTAEYPGAEEISEPAFSFDGADLFYFGCQLDCFIVVNGKKTSLSSDIFLNRRFARKPGSNTFAYSSANSLVMRYIEYPDARAGKLVDETGPARYNRQTDRYEALGRIGDRLYLLYCED